MFLVEVRHSNVLLNKYTEYTAPVIGESMNMDHLWHDIQKEEKKLSPWHIVHHKTPVEWAGVQQPVTQKRQVSYPYKWTFSRKTER